MKNFKTIFILIAIFYLAIISSCKKEEPTNPFVREVPTDTTAINDLDPKSIEGLYQKVFKPNCTTSGCHEGTFPPDFRSLESTYNTLVWADIVSNSPAPSDYMVEPYNADNSMLIKRITSFVPNTSGIMPLELLPESDYPTKKEQYIQDIKDWINDGAKDIFGNEANSINLRPQLNGFYITENGSSTLLARNVKGVVQIPATINNIDLYIAISDKETSYNSLTINKLLTSISRDDFSNASEHNMSIISEIIEDGYLGSTKYYHKVSISNIGTLWLENQTVFLKIIVNDGDNPDTDLPGINALEHHKDYFSFVRIP